MKIEKTYRVQIGQPDRVTIVLAGCGGTGSFLALHLARLACHARDRHGLDIDLVFVDPDLVEGQNVGRQNFCPAEVGLPKAMVLMRRYNAAFGLEIEARVAGIGPDVDRVGFGLVVGCVDNAAARRDICDLVKRWKGAWWWLDCGNHEQAGQVVLGNKELEGAEISMMGFCTGLPLPSVVHPELLEDGAGPSTGSGQARLSCAELALMDSQSLMVNQAVAGWAAQYVYRMVLARDLDVSATYVDLVAGSARSVPIVAPGDGDV